MDFFTGQSIEVQAARTTIENHDNVRYVMARWSHLQSAGLVLTFASNG